METNRTPLEVGTTALAVGEHSVGFPPSRTGNQLIEAYLELITLVRNDRPERLRNDDIEKLASETGFDELFIRNRVVSHMAAR